MRAVLDTNVAVSALLWGGSPEHLIEVAGEGRLELFTSDALIEEFARILGRVTFAARLSAKGISGAELVARYMQFAQVIEPARITPVVVRDPTDDAVLACAFARRRRLHRYRRQRSAQSKALPAHPDPGSRCCASVGRAGNREPMNRKVVLAKLRTRGEGGMLATADRALWSRAWSYKDHGKSWEAVYEREHPIGFKWLQRLATNSFSRLRRARCALWGTIPTTTCSLNAPSRSGRRRS